MTKYIRNIKTRVVSPGGRSIGSFKMLFLKHFIFFKFYTMSILYIL